MATNKPEETKPNVSETKVEHTTKNYKNMTKEKTDVPDTAKGSAFLKKNRGKIALGAVGFGIAKSWIDGEDDDVISSAGKGVKTGIITAGVAYGTEHLLRTATIQDMVKGELSSVADSVNSFVDKKRKMSNFKGKIGVAGRIGLIAVGAATVLDLGDKAKDRIDSAILKQQQELKIIERQRNKKKKNKESSYGHMNDGEIVFDLFNARTGHHKMGNSKFN